MDTSTKTRDQQLAEHRAEEKARSIAYAAERFGLKPDEVVGYNAGCCYDKVWVKTRTAARKVAASVKGRTCNGGWFDGMALGGITKSEGAYEVMC